jgi:hypothetical protein
MTDFYNLPNHPVLLFVVSFITMSISARIGWSYLRTHYILDQQLYDDFGFILTASLTLLSLIIGFSFSMATNRYDQRKNYEEAEANAIGTEYVRIDLLPAADVPKVRALLKQYLDLRIHFYEVSDEQELQRINTATAQLQTDLWAALAIPSAEHPTQIMALVVSGMNDVLNSQGYTQAAYWNRIPPAAWGMMAALAIGCNVLVGYGAQGIKSATKLFPILPAVVSFTFMLIADIDAPRHGIIQVNPQNLVSLAQSLHQSP